MNLLLIGCGNIGSVLLKVWVAKKLFKNIIVIQPSLSHANDFKEYSSVQFVQHANYIPANFKPTMVVFAIKPQMFHEVMPKVVDYIDKATIVSLMAGIKVETIISYVNHNSKIVRIMPNVAIKTGKSVNLAFANDKVLEHDLDYINKIFISSGKIFWLQQEKLIDTLSPISGSGPAYFFLLAETLVQASMRLDIDEEIARELVQQILLGSASLVSETRHFTNLINSVTSKGGITEAALKVMIPAFQSVMEEALKEALKRLEELSNENRS